MSEVLLSHGAMLIFGICVGILVGHRLASGSFRQGWRQARVCHEGETDTLIDGVKHAFAEISSDTYRQSSQDVLQVAQTALSGERRLDIERSAVDRAEIDARIGQILNQMDRMQALVRELEQTRAGQLGEVSSKLDEANKRAAQLTSVTDSLRRTLGNSRQRGMWGERLAEELLEATGMKAGISFRKQVKLVNGCRPDFTFDLPGGMAMHMDVKFPFDNFQKSLESEDNATRQRFETAFVRDVRQRIAEISNRGYTDPCQGSVEFALMFIPNERVFSAIMDINPAVLDEALRRHVVMVSPASLIAVLSIMHQLTAERRLSKAGRELAVLVQNFQNLWQDYSKAAEQVENQLEIVAQALQRLNNTKGRKLAHVVAQIDEVTSSVIAENHPSHEHPDR